jgi:hypothetical protein
MHEELCPDHVRYSPHESIELDGPFGTLYCNAHADRNQTLYCFDNENDIEIIGNWET